MTITNFLKETHFDTDNRILKEALTVLKNHKPDVFDNLQDIMPNYININDMTLYMLVRSELCVDYEESGMVKYTVYAFNYIFGYEHFIDFVDVLDIDVHESNCYGVLELIKRGIETREIDTFKPYEHKGPNEEGDIFVVMTVTEIVDRFVECTNDLDITDCMEF